MRKVGGQTKYSEAMHRDLVETVRSGVGLHRAARLCGICEDTMQNWRRKYPQLDEDLDKSHAERLGRLEKIVHKAAAKDWRAAAWALAKHLPAEYGNTDRAEHVHIHASWADVVRTLADRRGGAASGADAALAGVAAGLLPRRPDDPIEVGDPGAVHPESSAGLLSPDAGGATRADGHGAGRSC